MEVSIRPPMDALKGVPVAVLKLLETVQAEEDERRSVSREPFFRAVTVEVDHQGGPQQLSGFSRDISPKGIGLLHNFPLQPADEVVLTIHSENLGKIRVRSQIMWCSPCTEGWHLSGARFLELPI